MYVFQDLAGVRTTATPSIRQIPGDLATADVRLLSDDRT